MTDQTPTNTLTGFWDRLGVDEGGLPTHLPMGVNVNGEGPENDSEAHHFVCWCNDSECPLTKALALAAREAHTNTLRAAAYTDAADTITEALDDADPTTWGAVREWLLMIAGFEHDAAPAPTDNQHGNGLDWDEITETIASDSAKQAGWEPNDYDSDDPVTWDLAFRIPAKRAVSILRAVVDGPTTPTQETL